MIQSRRSYILIIAVCLLSIELMSQTDGCIDYPEIEGGNCMDCAPSGWTNTGTADIIDPSGSYSVPPFAPDCVVNDISGPSPSGGNMVLLSDDEVITTTISGLNTNVQYAFGIYWEGATANAADCFLNLGNGDLLITVDGTDYSYSGAIDWELVEICFTPSSSTIDIDISHDGPASSITLVDGADCVDLTPCCPLVVDVDNFNYSTCPDELINILVDYSDEQGNVDIEWTSDPPNGINYLNSTDIISPDFLYPDDTDFSGETFKYTVTVEDDNCTVVKECIEINVLPKMIPVFDIELCEADQFAVLPDVSDDGYSGTWSGDFDISNEGGDFVEFTFTLDPGQDNCLDFNIYTFFVLESIIPIFSFETEYCISDNFDYELNDESLNGISGTWMTNDEFNPSDLGVGNYTFEFVPDADYCAEAFVLDIEVLPNSLPIFDFDEEYCVFDGVSYPLNMTSLNGILGTWGGPSEFTPSVLGVGNHTFEFIPNGTPCVDNYILEIEVLPNVEITFDLPTQFCVDNDPYILPTVSTEGVIGSWNPATLDLSQSSGQETALFTASAGSECSEIYMFQYSINEQQVIPPFLPDTLCASGDTFYLEPIIGVQGSWNIDSINLTADSLYFLEYEIAMNNCYENLLDTILVVSKIIPSFMIPPFLCEQEEFNLPITSTDGITGSWSIPIISPSNIAEDTIVINFIPDDVLCYDSFAMTIDILRFDDFSIESSDPTTCTGDDGLISFSGDITNLEFSIDGSLTWNELTPITGLSSGTYTILVRHSVDPNCLESFNVELTAPTSLDITDVIPIDPSDCLIEDGSIEVIAMGNNLEYSLNGNDWQDGNTFSSLAAGNYTVYIRLQGNPNCEESSNIELTAPESPDITDINFTDPTDCLLDDGSIEVLAIGNDLEYSLNGNDWQDGNTFSSLAAGNYTVYIRLQGNPNCGDIGTIELTPPEAPSIVDVTLVNLNNCSENNGSILIITSNTNVEFTIDDGLTWQLNNLFENLSAGTYDIAIRSINSPNCLDSRTVMLTAPNSPEITTIEIQEPSDCISEDAQLTVLTNLLNVEFSLDLIGWKVENTFAGLMPGTYIVYVRDAMFPECITQQSVEIEQIDCPCNDLDISVEITDISCDGEDSGEIVITNIEGLYTSEPYSVQWDMGSLEERISNLSAGEYTLTVTYDFNCEFVSTYEIQEIDSLNFGLQSYDQNCEDLGSIEVINLSGGSGNFQFSLDEIIFQDTAVFFNLSADEYLVTIEDDIDCSGQLSSTIGYDSNLELDIPAIEPIQNGESVFLNPLINQLTIDSFSWEPSIGILNPGELIAEVAPTETTTYTLIIYFGECSEIRSITVEVIEEDGVSIYFPSIINTSSVTNNLFFPQGADDNTTIEYLRIYDRWGNNMYEVENLNVNDRSRGWDGTYKGIEVLQGVYVFIARLNKGGSDEIISGSLTVLR